jgi:hypothetical protein
MLGYMSEIERIFEAPGTTAAIADRLARGRVSRSPESAGVGRAGTSGTRSRNSGPKRAGADAEFACELRSGVEGPTREVPPSRRDGNQGRQGPRMSAEARIVEGRRAESRSHRPTPQRSEQ